jgi:coenzyme F420-reducing hydrogenase gamma subunit
MKYLGIEPKKPRIAVFDFTCCEGCELQLVNKEETLVDFLKLVDVVEFREASSAKAQGGFDVALIEGAVSRPDEVERLQRIRERAAVVVAFGTCACYGGVNKLKNAHNLDDANREVYGDHPKETLPVRRVADVIKVDLEVPGCPVRKAEVERIVQHVVMEVPFQPAVYPVCVECKQRFTTCMFDRGQLCLGAVTRAGCDAPCPAGGLGCLGCRGPAPEANFTEFKALAARHGYSERDVADRMAFFGTFEGVK